MAAYTETKRFRGRISNLAKAMGRPYQEILKEALDILSKYDCCEICGTKENLVFDHDHEHNYIRGLLCNGHNTMIGFSGESEDVLRNGVRYLMRKEGKLEAFLESRNQCA